MSKVYFLFGVHNHQPIGNFPHIFQEAYERCYFPFISLLEKFPKVRFSLHNSGCLYDWLLENKREYMEILTELVNRGQVEVISGGYYEPILPLICDEDKRGQIQLMNEFIGRKFKKKPQGIWVAERVWEPNLAKIINTCGLKYTFLDDTHFRYAGFKEKEFFGYYATEDEGKSIFVFPINKTLRYKIPFSKSQEAIDILNGFAKEGKDILITLFDDGEKFGLWPHTFDWVYKKEWLKTFLSLLEDSTSIETITPSQSLDRFGSQGIIYLPTASYEEMGEWVLEPHNFLNYQRLKGFLKENNRFDEFKDFLRGGFFRNFMSKYSRLNYMHKRMLSLSKKINKRVSLKRERKIFINLWKAQANCGYWHGIFGGFYLSHIRAAVYEHLISAENLLDKKYSPARLILEKEDIDLDGREEVILKNERIICCFSSKGGALLECSLRRPAFNLINTITRQEESYHKRIGKNSTGKEAPTTIHENFTQDEENLDRFLIYDKYERLNLIDHLLEKSLTLESFNQGKGVFTLGDRVYDLSVKRREEAVNLNYHYGNKELDFLKRVEFSSQRCGFKTFYKFHKKNMLNNYNFGIEFNLSLPSLKDIFKKEEKKNISLGQAKEEKNLSSFTIVDFHKKLTLEFSFNRADLFTLPLYSVSSSESGSRKVYQQLVVLFILKDKPDTFSLSFNVST